MQDWEDYIKTVRKLKTKNKKFKELAPAEDISKSAKTRVSSTKNNKTLKNTITKVKINSLLGSGVGVTKNLSVNYGFPNSHVERAVKSKRLKIQAKIDLHDLNLEEAYRRLSSFIVNSYNNDLNFLLVVTGKSVVSSAHRSTIRREFLYWLETNSELSEKISFYAEAFAKDGGAGAFYVFLR